MGRNYAGVLALVAFCTVLLRGLLKEGSFDKTIGLASLALWAFGAIGYVTGRIAEWIIEESVTSKVSAELDAQDERPKPAEKRAEAA